MEAQETFRCDLKNRAQLKDNIVADPILEEEMR